MIQINGDGKELLEGEDTIEEEDEAIEVKKVGVVASGVQWLLLVFLSSHSISR